MREIIASLGIPDEESDLTHPAVEEVWERSKAR